MQFCQVIVDIAHSQVDKVFEYSCPDDLAVGSRVKVPFGGRVVEGFVIGVSGAPSFDASKIKPVKYVYDEQPALVPECFSLMRGIAERYRVPKAVALRLFLPSEMRLGRVNEVFTKYIKLIDPDISLNKAAKKQSAALEALREGDREFTPFCEQFGRAAVNAIVEKGGAEVYKVRRTRAPLSGEEEEFHPVELTPAQQRALEYIEQSPKTVQLIHGVTGSGKTEIYLSYIAEVLKRGKTAIFLVPEISLTPQMLRQLRRRFKGRAAIMHSGLSAGERFDEWWRLRSGEAKIAIGARSAIFAPLENLGAIIIDEEHDSSYQSETAPRYSTIEIARMRAEYNGCKLILGSATPSVESYICATEGQYGLVELPDRINKKPLPHIIIADMREEVKRGNASAFSRALREELAQTLSQGNQAIIFLNRRGYAKTVICQDCGYVAKCENCDVSLTYHSEENCLKCHYCGAKYHMLSACPQCGGVHLRYGGTGTQRVVSDLRELFPKARILRMDNDTVSGKDGHYKILSSFGRREADILVGTQMIAKGHDFPSVTLVGILDADMSLHFADYRSGERTFQLITQVAGRSGRADEKGKVVLQTYSPENYILRYAVNYDYKGFFENEVKIRKATGFPPYSLICRVMVTAEEDRAALEVLKEVYFAIDALKQSDEDEFIFFNKMHSPIKKIQGKVRYQVLMRLKSGKLLPCIYDIAVRSSTADALAYVEENPANLS
ncbi:MAG TPA: primosomal protein N' [Candidatus Coproplasma excrementipullorum]|nr:primosomal protein N' [Candidatus Coproplasma excrementipullorum]